VAESWVTESWLITATAANAGRFLLTSKPKTTRTSFSSFFRIVSESLPILANDTPTGTPICQR